MHDKIRIVTAKNLRHKKSSSEKKREITKTGFDSSNPAGKFMSHKKTADALSIQNE